MKINGTEIGFSVTIGALKELVEKCPNRDIDNITQLFKGDDLVAALDNMAWFVVVLNKWYQYRKNRSFDGTVSADDVLALDMEEIQTLFAEAMKTFRKDQTPSTEVEPIKKKD